MSVKAETTAKPSEKVETNRYSGAAARCWHGMLFTSWLRLVWRNRFKFHPMRLGLGFTVTFATLVNSLLLRPIQSLRYGRAIERSTIKNEPIFIIGHWRSGTTLLHELLVLDERHAFPTTFECFVPNHFLVSEWLISKFRFLLPEQRPMDNMATGWERPQEDEFALCNMGLPSPYMTMAFPNNPPMHLNYLDMSGLTDEEVSRWKQGMLRFLRAVSLRKPKRMVLKSPPHTGRIKVLLELFPDARFVHIVRDPLTLFQSTVKLWKSMYMFQSLQIARHDGLEEYVFDCFERMYTALEDQRHLVDPSRFFELRYEDLARDPKGQIRSLYAALGLGEFDKVEPRLDEYLKGVKDYKPNKWQQDPEIRQRVNHRWGRFMRKYGYCQDEASQA